MQLNYKMTMHKKGAHLVGRSPSQTKIPCNRALAPTLIKMRTTNLQINFHGVNPPALPAQQFRQKVDDFYAARSGTIPALPWSNFAPPYTPFRA